MNKISVIGGGTGLSALLSGLKKLPFDISAIVSVCDDGSSTGRLRKEFNTPAVGDIRKVLISLSENEKNVGKLFNYRFHTSSDLNGHALGNLLLTGANDLTGNISDAVKLLNSLLKLKGKVLPLTDDNVTLAAKTKSGKTIFGEHTITESKEKIESVFYKKNPKVNPEVIKELKKSDAIILSMGSLFTSIIPNLLCKEIIETIDNSNAKIIYVCNIMTQPGETDDFSASTHIELINKYLGKRKIDAVVVNNGKIDYKIVKNYETKEQKDLVKIDRKKINKLKIKTIENDYILIKDGMIRHNSLRVGLDILSYLLD